MSEDSSGTQIYQKHEPLEHLVDVAVLQLILCSYSTITYSTTYLQNRLNFVGQYRRCGNEDDISPRMYIK